MKWTGYWSRRHVIKVSLQLAVCGAVESFLLGGTLAADENVAMHRLASVCAELNCSTTIAKACCQKLALGEYTFVRLSALILDDLSSNGMDSGSRDAIASSLREKSRQDFGREKTVSVDGWILSLTEARTYALTAFLGGRFASR